MNYWTKRATTLENQTYQIAKKKYKEVDEAFSKAEAKIKKEIDTWYQRLADNNEITLEDAKKLLDKDELKEFKWNVDEYIKYGQENALNQKWIKELENASAKFHIRKYEAELINIKAEYEKAFNEEQKKVESAIKDSYEDRYDHTAFELQKSIGVGFDVSKKDSNQIEKLIKRPWASDGKDFSERIWNKKDQIINTLQRELVNSILVGGNKDEAIKMMTKYVRNDIKNAKYCASRLIMTECSYFASVGQKDCFKDLDVEKYEIVATLDNKTSHICQEMDGKVFDMKDYEPGITAPPFHVFCRSTTAPYFDDEEAYGERVARDHAGNVYYVPSNMTYGEWKEQIEELKEKEREEERNGRNKSTIINKTYIESGEYRRKFDKMTDNEEINRVLYQKAKEMLYHRSGTNFEDMVWVDGNTGKIIYLKDNHDENDTPGAYSKNLLKKLKKYDNIITLHTHPKNLPPSPDDLNSFLKHNYKKSFVLCHNGKIYEYEAKEYISELLWELYKAEKNDRNDIINQEYALNRIAETHRVVFKEVE